MYNSQGSATVPPTAVKYEPATTQGAPISQPITSGIQPVTTTTTIPPVTQATSFAPATGVVQSASFSQLPVRQYHFKCYYGKEYHNHDIENNLDHYFYNLDGSVKYIWLEGNRDEQSQLVDAHGKMLVTAEDRHVKHLLVATPTGPHRVSIEKSFHHIYLNGVPYTMEHDASVKEHIASHLRHAFKGDTHLFHTVYFGPHDTEPFLIEDSKHQLTFYPHCSEELELIMCFQRAYFHHLNDLN